jgi:hypothetical protein
MIEPLLGHEPSIALRPLGSLEHFFWLFDQSYPIHFVMAAHVEGRTTVNDWRTALTCVQERHPLLSVCIQGSPVPHFRRIAENPIPLRVIEQRTQLKIGSQNSPENWRNQSTRRSLHLYARYCCMKRISRF